MTRKDEQRIGINEPLQSKEWYQSHIVQPKDIPSPKEKVDAKMTLIEMDEYWEEETPSVSVPRPRSARSEKASSSVKAFDADLTYLEMDEPWTEQPWELDETYSASAIDVAGDGGEREILVRADQSVERSTILPRADFNGRTPKLIHRKEERYKVLQDLGEGAAGDVMLAQDNDIHRLVAMKRLKKKLHTPSVLMRFVDEIQTTGALEHPNIVPIHDVGLDDQGLFYFVMKYVEGEDMASIIEKLKAGDAETHRRFPFEVRNQIFLKILEAVQFAHSQGIIHRDLKPANIMIGPYGEVMVMDWGLAKSIKNQKTIPTRPEPLFAGFQNSDLLGDEQRKRLFETRDNALMGTPAYMSPEQALGKNSELTELSDIYSLSVLYYEWIGLQYYMSHKETLQDLLYGILQEEPTVLALVFNEHQPNIPVELCHFVRGGLAKDPKKRFENIQVMIVELQKAISGKFDVKCPITLTKRVTNEALRFTDRFPLLGFGSLIAGSGLLLYASVDLAIKFGSALFGG